jgi:chloramphenicol-sensitive protein RarD
MTSPQNSVSSPSGIGAALGAFFLWGVLPIYWKSLQATPAPHIIAHRTLWALLILWGLLALQGNAAATLRQLRQPRIIVWHLLSGLLLAGNWLLYVWATLHERIIEAALGYYLNPFFNMLFGYLLFAERQTSLQKTSIAIALAGVLCQFRGNHGFPWIAITLALSFSLYAVVRKKSPLTSLPGLSLETLLLAPVALCWLMTTSPTLGATLRAADAQTILLICTGFATAIPLLLFGYAARTISLTTLGILQFLGPTLQFLIGWMMYREEMTIERTISFLLIWCAIGLYAYSLRQIRQRREESGETAP